MHWINFHTAASQCSLIHLVVWTMRKDFYVIFSPYIAEMQSCADTEWNMSIMDGCGFLSL